jgi:hypothetical protein
MLFRRLVEDARQHHVVEYRGAKIEGLEDAGNDDALNLSLPSSSDRHRLKAKVFVYAAGYETRHVVGSLLGINLPVRLWKSQMLLIERLSRNNVYHIDLDEVAIIHHRNLSIVNLSDDAVPVSEADFSINEVGASRIRTGLLRFLPHWDNSIHCVSACIKTDIVSDISCRRSLSVDIRELKRNHIMIMPGKMTQMPYLSDIVCRMVFDRIDDGLIARRPIDGYLEMTLRGDIV